MNDTNDEIAPPAAGEPDPGNPPPVGDDASTVWLVSFADNDDRELRAPQIAEALRLGEITADTIVWREGAPDWLPLSKVAELAKLLPASGETATAPLVAHSPALLRRAGAAPAAQDSGVKPATPSVKPMIAGRAVPVAKGTTKLGLPKFDPTKDRKTDATPLPKVSQESPRLAPAAPKPTVLDTTPTRPRPVAPDVTPTQPRPAAPAAPARGAKIDVFGPASDDEEEAPISIEPVFSQPPSPAPARAMQRAKALSPGTLGVAPGTPAAKKKPPAPPRPPEKRGAPEPEPSPNPGTPSLGTLAAPVRVEPKPAVAVRGEPKPPVRGQPKPRVAAEGLLDAETLLKRAIAMDAAIAEPRPVDAPTIDVASLATEPVAPMIASPDALSSTPTESSASIAVPRDEEASDAPVSQARAAAPSKPAGKSPWPIVAAAAAVVLLGWLFMQGKRDGDTHQAEPSENTPAKVAEPATPPPEPASPPPAETIAQPAAENPTPPAMTAEAEPTVPEPKTGVVEPAKEKVPAPAKPETTTVAKEAKPAEAKPAAAAASEAKAAAAKPAAPAPEQKEVAVGGDFDRAAAASALTGSAQEASGCRKEGDPSGVAVVHVTFSNTGKATRAVIEGPPFAGTATGGCIAATLRRATVPPYGGDRVTVTKKVVIH